MEWIPLKSSLIARIRYFSVAHLLEVELRGGRTYRYFGVPKYVFQALQTSEAPGVYFNTDIKPIFDSIELTSAEEIPIDASLLEASLRKQREKGVP